MNFVKAGAFAVAAVFSVGCNFQVNGVIRSAKWKDCRILEIRSEGQFKEFNDEAYMDGLMEKYPGLKVDLIHHQWY